MEQMTAEIMIRLFNDLTNREKIKFLNMLTMWKKERQEQKGEANITEHERVQEININISEQLENYVITGLFNDLTNREKIKFLNMLTMWKKERQEPKD